ncbi:MAG TPA: PQQ-binding-like beta-propeller repeat protein, partial [Pirellulales bacterium]|nr:PQQ-binding-like beta-propeller repeat protein [Pirellulales bacterium]
MMDRPSREVRGRSRSRGAVSAALVSWLLLSGELQPAAFAQRGFVQPPAAARRLLPRRGLRAAADPDAMTAEGVESVFYPPDRSTMQKFSQARELLGEKRYGEAVRLLGDLLALPEDGFFQPDRDSPVFRSLKGEARRLIGEMPAEGKASYELQYGAQARKMLVDAIAAGDADALAAISRQFFHTEAGYEATYLLGSSEMESGRPLAAALCLRRLQETAQAATPFEPTLSLKLAACWLRAGMSSQAAAVLLELKRVAPNAEFQIAGKTRKLFSSDSQAIAWLSAAAGEPAQSPDSAGPDQWTMYRGGPTRNAASPGSSPLLNRRWAVPSANDPQLERQLSDMQQEHLEQGGRLTPGLHPLAVKDYVFMRSVNGLEAIDFRTGKRIWNGPLDKQAEEMLRQSGPAAQGRGPSPFSNWLEQRVWDDATYGTLSSDGDRLYCVEDLAGNLQEAVPGGGRPQQLMVVNNGRVVTPNTIFYNRLAAYEIATEGKLSWELGGEPQEDELRLAGAFFLGPPLPLAGRLYVLAELKGEVRLLALEAESGDVLWSQQIAIVERSILEDPLRRVAGATPSYSDGVLVCPTSAGAVVAVDLTTRSLLWGYQYPRAVDPSYQNRMLQLRFGGLPQVNDASESDRWADASVTIAEGRVLLTPVESPNIHCLDLVDGKLEWQKPRDGGIYVACVHDGKVVIVDSRNVRALRLADGEPAWPEASVLPSGAMPSGRGFFDGERYFLPLTSAEVDAIDVETGKIVGRSRSRSGAVPGNLICYQGAVISQGIDQLECFYQLDDLRKQVAATLAAHPNNPPAVARHGELLLDEGKLDAAIAELRRSFELQSDPRTRELLVDALLEGLRLDFAAHREQVAEVERLADQPAQQARLLRLTAAGLQQAGDALAAFDAYLRMVDLTNPPRELEKVEQGLSVRRDRWVRARLAALWESAELSDRATMRQKLQARLAEAKDADDPDSLRAFISFFEAYPEADEARELLAVRLLGGESRLEAEQLLLRLERSPDADRARAAVARLAELLCKAGRYADAAQSCQKLQDEWADVVCLDGKTGRQLVEAMSGAQELRRQLAGPVAWPEGEVETHAEQSPSLATFRNSAIDFRGPQGPFFEHATLESDQQQGALVARDGLGRETWRVALHERGGMNNMGFNPAINHVRVDGHFLLASLGYQLVAIDTLGASAKLGPRVLWRQDLSEGGGAARQATIRAMAVQGGQPRIQAIDSHGRPIGNTGPVGDDFVCFQRLRNLAVVHPLDGETLWVRSDIPAGSDIFGDDKLLFVSPQNSHEALVFRTADGQELGRRALPSLDQRVTTLGRLALVWSFGDANGKATLKLLDPWEQKELWRREFDVDAKFALLGEEAIGVMQRNGRFVLLSLPEGRATIDAEVAAEPSLNDIYLVRSATRDLLLTNRPQQRNNINVMPAPNPGVVIDGMVHGFDRTTGQKVFSTRLEHKGLSTSQPYDLPILTFAANIHSQKGNVSTPHGNVMCLDKRNGRVLYEEDLPGPINMVDVSSDVDKHEVVVRTIKSSKRLVFTDRPVAAPPETKPDPAKKDPNKKDQPKTTDSTSRKAGRAVLRGFRKWLGEVEATSPIASPETVAEP